MELSGRFANRWEQLSATPHRLRTAEQDQSVMFHLAEQDPSTAPAHTGAWLRRCEEVESFVMVTARDPREHSDDSLERRLGLWLRKQRQREGSLCEFQLEKLRKLGLARGLLTRFDRYRERAFDYADFIDGRGREPSTRASDPDERRLAYWLRRQQRLLNSQSLTSTREQLLAQVTRKEASVVAAVRRPLDRHPPREYFP